MEKGNPETERVEKVENLSSYEFKQLKPCTEYEHQVTFINKGSILSTCNATKNSTSTVEMRE